MKEVCARAMLASCSSDIWYSEIKLFQREIEKYC